MFPNVETMFRSDIETMKDFCALAQPEHLVMLKEVEKQFLTEFDFREEANNLRLVRDNMKKAWPRHVGVVCGVFLCVDCGAFECGVFVCKVWCAITVHNRKKQEQKEALLYYGTGII